MYKSSSHRVYQHYVLIFIIGKTLPCRIASHQGLKQAPIQGPSKPGNSVNTRLLHNKVHSRPGNAVNCSQPEKNSEAHQAYRNQKKTVRRTKLIETRHKNLTGAADVRKSTSKGPPVGNRCKKLQEISVTSP